MYKIKNVRRQIVLGGILGAISTLISAQTKIDNSGKSVKIIVGFPPGQATDSVARLLADKFHLATGDNYIVDNRPGQGGSMALGQLAKSPPNGSVMMIVHMSAIATNPAPVFLIFLSAVSKSFKLCCSTWL